MNKVPTAHDAARELSYVRTVAALMRNTHGKPLNLGTETLIQVDRSLDVVQARLNFLSLSWWGRCRQRMREAREERRALVALAESKGWLPNRWLPVALVLVLGASGCTHQKSAIKALDAAGYSRVELTGAAWWCCNGSTFSDGFRAVGPTGVPVEGCVCRGLLKGSTIRLR